MELTVIEQSDDLTHVALAGQLDLQGVEEIEDTFYRNTTSREKPVIVDMAQVNFIGSLGIGMLVRVSQSMRTLDMKMVMMNTTGLVDETLRIANIDKLIPIVSTREEALDLLR